MTLYPMNEKRILISVCIATYKREKLLEMLLQSLTEQVLEQNIMIEIIVTDNNIEESAKSILRKFISTDKISFKYFIQPIKNISLTRNVCVENATGDYICFIDDDETADKNWIGNLLNCVHKFNADGAFGYVEPVFDHIIPGHFKQREFYFSAVGNTGSIAKFYYTTNCLIKTELIKSERIPFDPDYGLTGGEDVHLFERLVNKGAKFICSKEAVTYEFIPQNRGNYKYLFNRALRGGQSYLRRNLERRNELFFKIKVLTKIIFRFLYGIFLFFLYPISKKKSVLGMLSIGDAIGKTRALFFKFKALY
jgi:succinoglycan biosynthesis protein ExoM